MSSGSRFCTCVRRAVVLGGAVAGTLLFLPMHLVHDMGAVRQNAPRLVLWIASRYEHLILRPIELLTRWDWLQRFTIIRRLVDWLGRVVMSIVNGEIMTLDEVEEMLDSIFDIGYTVAVGTCPCRRARKILSDEVPNNTDMVFGLWAEEYLDHYPGLYYRLERDEAKELVESFERYGFIHQLYGFRSREGAAYVLCNCDPEICIPLRAMKKRGYEAFRKGRSVAVVDPDSCLGIQECGACLERCQFDARKVVEGKVEVDPELCYGCGLCLSSCQGNATALERKKGAQLVYARYLVE